jgi:integrase
MKKRVELYQIQTHVYKKTHRSGAVTWVVRWKSPVSGKWRVAAAGKTRSEAMLFEAKVRKELALGQDPGLLKVSPTGRMTIAELIDHFYGHSRFIGGSRDWQVENRARIEKWIRPELGHLVFLELDANRIMKFYVGMRDQGLGRPTIHKTHTLLCCLGDVYQELSPDAENPARRIKTFSKVFPKKAPKREINFLTPEELAALFQRAVGSHQKLLLPLIQFLAATGLRRSEALNLQWTDVDAGAGFIHVRQSKNGKARTIPLEQEAWNAIHELRGNGPYVFTYETGERPHEDSFLKPLRRAARLAGIHKRIDLHTFRHSYGSNKVRAGWGLKKVSLLLGHSDISITAGIYTHLLDADLRVQDQFRFDRPMEAFQDPDKALAQALIRNLLKSPEGIETLKAAYEELNGSELGKILENAPLLLRKRDSE